MYKWGFEKERHQRSNSQHSLDHGERKEVPEKTSTSALFTMLKPLTVCIITNHGKFLKTWEYGSIRSYYLSLEKPNTGKRSNS